MENERKEEEKMTAKTYFEEWLSSVEPTLQKSTYEGLTIYINKHFLPEFGSLTLEQITPKVIQTYLNKKTISGRLDNKSGGLSPVTLKKHLSILRQAFGDAVLNEYIHNNPARYCKIKRVDTLSKRTYFLTLDEAKSLLHKISDTTYKAVFLITLYYGLRRSELLGLKWDAVNYDKNTLTIQHTVVKNLTIERKDSTKTATSCRTFQLLPEVKEVLQQVPKTDIYIFPIRPDTLTRSFQKQIRKAGWEKMRFHDIRHSTASILFEIGWSIEDIKNWLGHADIETTSSIYLHYQAKRKVMLAENLHGLLI